MYIKRLNIENLRCIRKAQMDFVYPLHEIEADNTLRFPNINLIIGDNGAGKTSILKAIALSCLAPVVQDSGFRPFHLVRREEGGEQLKTTLKADLILHEQDAERDKNVAGSALTENLIAKHHVSTATVNRIEDQESIRAGRSSTVIKQLLSQDDSSAFLVVGYGAARRAETSEAVDEGARNKFRSKRYQRFAGLFEDNFSLMPITSLSAYVAWQSSIDLGEQSSEIINSLLPEDILFQFDFLKYLEETIRVDVVGGDAEETNSIDSDIAQIIRGVIRNKQLIPNWNLSISKSEDLSDADYEKILLVTGQLNRMTVKPLSSENHFTHRGVSIPFTALSDGYRAFLSWLGDLLYHLCEVCPEGVALRDLRGIVMVDEIDLHLHPSWQREVIEKISNTFPRIQWIITSHSPLIVSSVEPENIFVMEEEDGAMVPRRYSESTYGRTSDQMLTSPYFGLPMARVNGAQETLEDLARRAANGDREASLQYLRVMNNGVANPEFTN